MSGNDKAVHLGDGVSDKVKESINENLSDTFTILVDKFFDCLKDKIEDIPNELEKLLSSLDIKHEIVAQWSTQLFEKRTYS